MKTPCRDEQVPRIVVHFFVSMVDKQLRLQRYYFSYFIARRREKVIILLSGILLYFSITGKPARIQ
jgi:hypothetical protein